MGTFKEYINEKKLVDIRDIISDKREISKLWANGLSYDGKDIYDLYMKNCNDIKDKVKENFEDSGTISDFDGQEVYLGYDKSKDEFLSGWDCWVTEETENPDFDEDEDEDEYIEEDLSANATVIFKIIKGKLKIVDTISWTGDTFYDAKGNEGYKAIKKNKDVVDIRLD